MSRFTMAPGRNGARASDLPVAKQMPTSVRAQRKAGKAASDQQQNYSPQQKNDAARVARMLNAE
jgi:hypothetical protein